MIVFLDQLQFDKEKVVLCHGVFDILHAGHIRHFQEAKKLGNILVVSITPDRYVNKGPGRPIFNQNVRAKVIDALEMVDYVVINNQLDAMDVLEQLKPEVYCKGSEVLSCPSLRVYHEREFVLNYGGQMVFIDMVGEDDPISSSRIINSLLPEPSPEFSQITETISFKELEGYFEEIKRLKILVVGEYILDDYIICTPLERASKEMIVPMLYKDRKMFHGGAAIVAINLAQFCDNIVLLTLGNDISVEDDLPEHLELRMIPYPSVRKRRLVEEGTRQKVSELTFLTRDIPIDYEGQLHRHLKDILSGVNLVVCADYGHGLFTPSVIGRILGDAEFIGATAQANAANYGFNLITKWLGAEYLVADEKELRLATGQQFGDVKDMLPDIMTDTGAELVCTTLGSRGCVLFDGSDFHYISAIPATVVDTMGAGDAFLSITAPFAKLGINPQVIGLIGNAYAAMKVGIFGNEPVNPIGFKKFLKTLWS